MDPAIEDARMGQKKSSSTRVLIIAIIVVLVAAAIYYYVKVYKPKHASEEGKKDGYHAPWGMTSQAHKTNQLLHHGDNCLSPEQATQHGCEMECAEFTDGMSHSDCVYKCLNGSKRAATGGPCRNC